MADPVVRYIRKDVERGRNLRPGQILGVAFLAAAIPILLGIGLRSGAFGETDAGTLLHHVSAAIFVGGLVVFYAKRAEAPRPALYLSILVLFESLQFAMVQMLSPVGPRTAYANSSVFWAETRACFFRGTFSVVVLGALLGYFALRMTALPTLRWRVILAAGAGVSATVMLGFHCDSSSVRHVLYGHVGPALVVGSIVFAILEWRFRREVQAGAKSSP